MTTAPQNAAAAMPQPITSSEEAERTIVQLMDVMDALLQVIEEETALVRAGRLASAAQLEKSKADLARLYVTAVTRLKAGRGYLMQTMPDNLAALHRRHDTFRALLQLNLTVLATAHAVSEGIIRGVSGELARKTGPQTYGASGRPTPVATTSYQPIALSRTF
jgi:hypothetical protein